MGQTITKSRYKFVVYAYNQVCSEIMDKQKPEGSNDVSVVL